MVRVTSDYETIMITFAESIQSIDTMFTQQWGATSLKDWLEGYATRFIQISDRLAIITSAYNMLFVKGWLKSHTKAAEFKDI